MNPKQMIKATVAGLTTALLTTAAYADFTVSPQGKGGVGKLAQNMAAQTKATIPLWEIICVVGAFISFMAMAWMLYKKRASRGQDGDMGMVFTLFLVGVILVALPEFMGHGVASVFGGGSVQVLNANDASIPNFSGN